jgi:hypothetical protein
VFLYVFRFKRPVRCVLDRDEDTVISGGRHPYLMKYQVYALVCPIVELRFSPFLYTRFLLEVHVNHNIPTYFYAVGYYQILGWHFISERWVM